MRMHNPPHPGPIVKEALDHLGLTVTEFAGHLGVSRVTLSRILNGNAGITPEMSIRIGQAFGQSEDLWYKVQTDHDFWLASQSRRKKIKALRQAA